MSALSAQNEDIPTALYHATLGKLVLDYIQREDGAAIQKAMESQAVRILESIRLILEDDTLSDAECYYKIDALVGLFFRELEISTRRHWEAD